jgi:mannose/fructose/sorbose-specific phosphotransferase system IIB component
MDIQLVRIDDRLIHGQVVVGWVKALGIGRLVVVNDAIAANSMQKTLMEMAVPTGLKVSFFTVEEAARKCLPGGEHPEKGLLLFSNPSDVLGFVQKGALLSSVNVGGMHFCEGKQQVSKTVCVNDRDVEAFRELKGRGIELEVRAVPGDMKASLEKFLPQLNKP